MPKPKNPKDSDEIPVPRTEEEAHALCRRMMAGEVSDDEQCDIAHDSRFPGWIRGLAENRVGLNPGRALEREVLAKIGRNGIGTFRGGVARLVLPAAVHDCFITLGGREILVFEIIRKLRLEDVREFLDERLPQFVGEFPGLVRGRKVYGALAFQLDADDGKAVALARENGLMLVRINSRRRIEVLNPDTAQLRNIAG